MGRPNKLTDDAATPVDWVKNVSYGVASEMSSMQFYTGAPTVYYTETRQYNTRLQMTRLTTSGGPSPLDMEYRYSATQNNGRIMSQKDWVSGEDVTYQYDSLNRLISAVTVGPEWGQSFGYDGFGNLLSQTVTKGSAPAMSINVDAATNRIATSSGYGYDLNGNVTAMPGQSGMTYDVDNRLATATGDTYAYAPDNKRVWKKRPDGSQEIYFYGLGGKKLGAYIPRVDAQFGLYIDAGTTNLYFGGKLIRAQGQTVVTDRLGSVRSSGMRYFPYGAEQTVTAQDRDKFATYYREGTTGLDYADQRYYGSTVGRFATADPYQASGGPSEPGSWNRYAYVEGDPINYTDRHGRDKEYPDVCDVYPWSPGCNRLPDFPPDVPLPLPEYPPTLEVGSDTGVQRARAAAAAVWFAKFKDKPDCMKLLNALVAESNSGMNIDQFIDQIQETARGSANGIFDGPDSGEPLTASSFPGAAEPGVATVGQWFQQYSGRLALSKYDDHAIYIRSSAWGILGPYTDGRYAAGTIMHEVMHKQQFGFSPTDSVHSWFTRALNRAGLSQDFTLGRNREADILGRLCF